MTANTTLQPKIQLKHNLIPCFESTKALIDEAAINENKLKVHLFDNFASQLDS